MESDGERSRKKKERERETRRPRDGEKKKKKEAYFDLGAKARHAQQMASFLNFLFILELYIIYFKYNINPHRESLITVSFKIAICGRFRCS